uniref:SH3 domain-containing protein n=1 Tax=Rhipicephalus pulchellus TaxID=72859 RepID=L7M4C5_RHIPC
MALTSGFPCAVLFLAFLCEINFVRAPSPPTRILCVDKGCQGKLGEGITLQAYAPIVDGYVSFSKNEKVTVLGRTENSDVLHIEVRDKRGYAPENVIKIEKMFFTKDQLVEVEVVSMQPSKTVLDEATQATVQLTEPVPTEATPSPPIVKRCRIYGTVMSGSICDDEEASELIEEVDAATQLGSSVDDSPTSSLDSWSPSFTTDVKLDLASEVYSGKASEEIVTASSTVLPGFNHAQGDDADVGKEKAASSEQLSSTSSETAKDEGVEVSVEVEGEDEQDAKEEKPIPGEVDEEDETPSDEDHVKDEVEITGAASSLEPSGTGLSASSSDEVALSDLSTPSLPVQQPDLATTDQLLSSTVLLSQSSASTSEGEFLSSTVLPLQSSASTSEGEASLPSETDLSASLVDKPSVVTSMDGPPTESQLPSLPTSSQDVYSSQSLEQPSSLSTATTLPVETGLGTNAVGEPALTPSSVDTLSDQLHSKPATSEDVGVSSSLLSEQSSPSTSESSLSRETEPVESSTEKLNLSDATVPPVEPRLTEESSFVDSLSAILSSVSDETPISSIPAPQPVEASLSSSSAAKPAVSELPVSSQEQQMQGSPLAESLVSQLQSSSADDSIGTTVLPFSYEGTGRSSFVEPSESILATPSLEEHRADIATSEDLFVTTPLAPLSEETPSVPLPEAPRLEDSSAESAATPMSSVASLTESSSLGDLESAVTSQAEVAPPEPTAEALVSPSLLPADGLAASPEQAKMEPSQEQPSGGAADWGVIEEYFWQMLALLPEPLRAALDRRLLPSPVPLLLACCGLLVASMAITLHATWLSRRKASSLAGNMSMLEQRLFTLETERQVLSEQLVQAKAQADRGGRTLSQHERELDTLREEVQNQEEELRKLRTRLSEQTQKLEASQVALAVAQKTLMEKESEVSEQSAALASLEQQLSEACAERDHWREQATESQAQERSLQQSLSDATDTSDRLWSELEALKHKQEALCEEVSASNQETTKMAEQLKQKDERIQVLESSLAQLEVLQRHRTTSEGENEAETDADEEGAVKAQLQELLDATQARKERDQLEEHRRQLQAQLEEMQEQLRTQQVRVESLEKELEKSAEAKAEAERQSAEARTKLDVLSNYFKDRELQLQKEVGMQEVERRQRETEASTATQQLTLLERQCQSYKSQLSSLRQEMEISERNYKNQVADQEKRAHENWLAARAAERKLEEANRDRTALRQRLTLLEREMQQPPPLPPGDLFPPRPPLLTKDDVPLLDGAPPLPPLDMLPPPPFPPFPPPPPPELLKHMRATGGSPHFFDMAPPPPPFVPRPGRSSQASVSSSASDSRGRPLKSSPQPLSADNRRNGTGGRNTPL